MGVRAGHDDRLSPGSTRNAGWARSIGQAKRHGSCLDSPHATFFHDEDQWQLGAQGRWVIGDSSWRRWGCVVAAIGTGRVLRATLSLPDGAELDAIEVASMVEERRTPPTRRRLQSDGAVVETRPTRTTTSTPSSRGRSSTPARWARQPLRMSRCSIPAKKVSGRTSRSYCSPPSWRSLPSFVRAHRGGKSGDGAIGYGIGDGLLGEATIVRIEQRSNVRRDDGTVEFITMEEGKTFEKAKGDGKKKPAKDDDSGVSKEGDKFVVKQELIDQILENPTVVQPGPGRTAQGARRGGRRPPLRNPAKSVFHWAWNQERGHRPRGERPVVDVDVRRNGGLQRPPERKELLFDLTRRSNRKTQEYEIR